MVVPTECPVCRQRGFQRVTVARAAGTSVGVTGGIAVGMAGSGDVGAATYRGITRTQTALAASLNSQELRTKRRTKHALSWVWGVMGLGFALLVLIYGENQSLAALFLIGFGVISAYNVLSAPSEQAVSQSEELDRKLDMSWVCLRCGNVWESA